MPFTSKVLEFNLFSHVYTFAKKTVVNNNCVSRMLAPDHLLKILKILLLGPSDKIVFIVFHRTLVKSVYQKINFLISKPKHML